MIPLITAYILDLIIGDPQGFPHPIRLIGNLISFVESKLRERFSGYKERKAGLILWFIVVGLLFVIPLIILLLVYRINMILGLIIEGIMCYYILAARSLNDESMKVYYALEKNNLPEARRYLSYIVGRDTKTLDEAEIAKAAVETVAENTTDGVIAPMLFIILGGAPLGFTYKAINTLDSMVGYKNDKYINMGRFSARADDVANFLPARIGAFLMMAAAFILGMNYKNAFKIFKRDRFNHKSPNSAQTESVCAGALGIMLGGDSYYGGKLISKPAIGDDLRKIEFEDIKRANMLMLTTSLICLVIGAVLCP
jgi:adenosylcobinamide-phosphate synthase